ncbi:MAG: ATP-dependent DNA helicase [Desulfobacterales bacterium]|jgi:DNA excision repair protein ERCC-2
MTASNRSEKIREKGILKIGVRDIVARVLRSGDLAFAFSGPSRAMAAIRAHQRIQQSRPAGYMAEVPVSGERETARFVLQIGGRIDGILPGGDPPVVEEIKTTAADPDEAAEAENPLHWGQLKVYAYLYAAQNELDAVLTRLTYFQLDTGNTRQVEKRFSFDALRLFFDELVDRYAAWATTVVDFRRLRGRSIDGLLFPYPDYRPGQREMAVSVYRTIRDSGHHLVQAATGIGKTMAGLFPAIKAMGEGLTEKIFYLTARTTARTAAEAAAAALLERGMRLKVLTLTAKDKICFLPAADCRPEACPHARGHYDRINAAVDDAFSHDEMTRSRVEAAAEAHRVCPFELSLELSLWADLIICDYNYAFDPRVYLRRFFEEETGGYTFLVDEAHNLVDRSREMFSAELQKQPFLDVRRKLKTALPGVFKAMGRINTWMLKTKKAGLAAIPDEGETAWADSTPPETLLLQLRRFASGAERWLAKNRQTDFREPLQELYFAASAFLRIAERYDDRYVTVYRAEKKDLSVKLFCVDPSGNMAQALNRCRAAVFFSATLTPMDYFREVFGCGDSAGMRTLPSPFPTDRLGIFVYDQASTYFRDRAATAPAVARAIRTLIEEKEGNYLLFFPSYAYLEQVLSRFAAEAPHVETLVQKPAMAETDREAFLARFSAANTRTLAGFAVMGGIFGEGIDLAGDRLSGAAVVGVGLPGICLERDVIRRYYAEANGLGFEYAYQYPGINRVMQAAGRVIRSAEDRGAVLLIDTRFSGPRYRSLFPAHWQPQTVRSIRDLQHGLRRFWSSTEPAGQ